MSFALSIIYKRLASSASATNAPYAIYILGPRSGGSVYTGSLEERFNVPVRRVYDG